MIGEIEEVLHLCSLSQHEVVIEVDEVSGEARDPVQVHLDGICIKNREVLNILEDFFVADYLDPGVFCVEPGGDLAIGHDVYIINEGSILLDGSQGVE